MKLRTLISLKNEPFLEKWARLFRYTKADFAIEEKIANKKKITLIDFGCGQDILYYKYLTHIYPSLKEKLNYVGIDPLVRKSKLNPKNVILISKKFETVSLKEKADVISIFAVLEHVDDPAKLLQTASKLLKPDGIIIATTPSPLARYPLEFFSYILGIIAKREIDEHQRYPDRKFLLGMEHKLPGLFISHEYFELGLNNFCIISKSRIKTQPSFSAQRDFELVGRVLSQAFRET